VLAALVAGCGGGGGPAVGTLYPVKGQVLLPSGKPLNGGAVVFLAKGRAGTAARGEVDSGGNFTLKTGDQDGAAAGEYNVVIEPPMSALRKSKTGLIDPQSLPFPSAFADPDGSSGLTATVKAEPTTLPPLKLSAENPKARTRDND
jgi:hypothetical protein